MDSSLVKLLQSNMVSVTELSRGKGTEIVEKFSSTNTSEPFFVARNNRVEAVIIDSWS